MHGRVTGLASSLHLETGIQICSKWQLHPGVVLGIRLREEKVLLRMRAKQHSLPLSIWDPAWGGFAAGWTAQDVQVMDSALG